MTLNGLSGQTPTEVFSCVARCVVMDDEQDLPFEIERFKRDWRRRGQPFEASEASKASKAS